MPLKYTPAFSVAASLLSLALLSGCASLPGLEERSPSSFLPIDEARETRLGQAASERAARHLGVSGLYLLDDPRGAFAARALLAQAAERTLDVQYYIWENDLTGTLLIQALLDAARRGVRVRLLLDDLGNSLPDNLLAALSEHPNIEVRLFNPFKYRKFKYLGFVTDFSRVNRRMHNKSFTADNQATIVGGRNVGDEYFGATDGTLFSDLDVLAIGPVVQETSGDFDRYWASGSAYPVRGLLADAAPDTLENLWARTAHIKQQPKAQTYLKALEENSTVTQLLGGELDLVWAPTHLLSDDPAKGLGEAPQKGHLIDQISSIIGGSERSLDIVSAYFVPTKHGTRLLTGLANRGVNLNVLTNSLSATDVAMVHAGYAKWRKQLLAAGISLFEMTSDEKNASPKASPAPLSSSSTSLHAKTFALDGETLFIGSFNFDPRSATLNTELGFLIEDVGLAQALHRTFNDKIPARAYQVKLSEENDLYWVSRVDGQNKRYDTEPNTSWWKRQSVKFFALLPIDWLL
ncbi:phospholipase D family protein [Halomonas sp. M20]|uniref:phospholipase D family protein n=1 Tax=Halomonas sp. M20 TaxID=2763264 RepID=UPI001D0B362E|nr:phospholipase D family protein [Halomonas sp. M20]